MNRNNYALLVDGKQCRWCEYPLPARIQNYNHGGGWRLDGYTRLQWLYVECLRCGYQWSLAKLGIPKNAGDIVVASGDAQGARHDI